MLGYSHATAANVDLGTQLSVSHRQEQLNVKLLLKTFLRRASAVAEMAGDRVVSMTKHKHMQVYMKQ